MARAPRVEFEGAQYHVMCRGDRREPIFADPEDHGIFLVTLGQASKRSGWLVHAYALMRNHYHLLLETPGGNLVEGMRWFQTTYTARFNARHRVSGHLFQGRYKALLIDPGESTYARSVADYIHLNPVRAKDVQDEKALADLAWSSYRHYVRPREKPHWQVVETVYGDLGLSSGKPGDRRRFRRYMGGLIDLEMRERGGKRAASALSTGWLVGGDAFRERMEQLVETVVGKGRRDSFTGPSLQRTDEKAARRLLGRAFHELGLEPEGFRLLRKNDLRKQAVAWLLKGRTNLSNAWICERLSMGHWSNLSRAFQRLEVAADPEIRRLKRRMLKCTD